MLNTISSVLENAKLSLSSTYDSMVGAVDSFAEKFPFLQHIPQGFTQNVSALLSCIGDARAPWIYYSTNYISGALKDYGAHPSIAAAIKAYGNTVVAATNIGTLNDLYAPAIAGYFNPQGVAAAVAAADAAAALTVAQASHAAAVAAQNAANGVTNAATAAAVVADANNAVAAATTASNAATAYANATKLPYSEQLMVKALLQFITTVSVTLNIAAVEGSDMGEVKDITLALLPKLLLSSAIKFGASTALEFSGVPEVLAKVLAGALGTCTSYTSFKLIHNYIHDKDIGDGVLAEVALGAMNGAIDALPDNYINSGAVAESLEAFIREGGLTLIADTMSNAYDSVAENASIDTVEQTDLVLPVTDIVIIA